MQRRQVLAAWGAAVAGATAGCSGLLTGGDGGEPTAPSTMPDSVAGQYTGFQGGPAHRGLVEGDVGGDLAAVWTHSEPSDPTGHQFGTPAVADGTVYAPEGTINGEQATGYLTALDLATGEVDWQYEFEGTNVGGQAVYADGIVFTLMGGVLVAVDAASGEEQWRLDADLDSAPAVADGRVYVSGSTLDATTLYALDAASGEELWTREFSAAMSGGFSTPAVADGVVYNVEEQVVGLDAATGEQVWSGATDEPPGTAPAVTDDTLYVGTAGNGVAAVSLGSGRQRWWNEAATAGTGGGPSPPASPAVADGTVLTTSSWAGTAWDAGTGEEVWSGELGADGPPVVAGDTMWVAGLNTLAGVATGDGSVTSEFVTENDSGGGLVTPAVVDDAILYPSDKLYALTVV